MIFRRLTGGAINTYIFLPEFLIFFFGRSEGLLWLGACRNSRRQGTRFRPTRMLLQGIHIIGNLLWNMIRYVAHRDTKVFNIIK